MIPDSPRWSLTPFNAASDRLPDDWQQLNERCCGAHPLLHPMFLEPLLRHFGGSGLYLARMDNGSGCHGIALVRRMRTGRWALFQPSQAPLGPIIIDLTETLFADAINGLIKSLPGFPLELDLTLLDPKYLPLTDCDPLAERILHATTMGVTVASSFEDYWKSRKKQLIYNLRRYQRRLEDKGIQPVMAVITEAGQMDAAVDDYGDLEITGWKGKQGTAIHRSNTQGRLYREIMRAFAAQDQGLVFRMMIDGRLAACWLIIMSGGMAVMLKTTFDEKLKSYAVGRVILYHTLKHLFERDDLRIIEFYTNANADQLQWGNAKRPIYHLNYYRYPWVRECRQALRVLLRPLRRPAAESAATTQTD